MTSQDEGEVEVCGAEGDAQPRKVRLPFFVVDLDGSAVRNDQRFQFGGGALELFLLEGPETRHGNDIRLSFLPFARTLVNEHLARGVSRPAESLIEPPGC